MLFVLYYVGCILIENIQLIDFSKLNISVSFLIIALSFEILTRLFIGLGYHQLLIGFNTPLSPQTALSISWVSFLGRYFPGKIALIVSAAYFLKKQNIPLKIAGAVPVINTLVTIFAGLLLSVPIIYTNRPLSFKAESVLIIGFLALIFLFLLYSIRHHLFPSFFKRLRLEIRAINCSSKTLLICSAIALLQCLSGGLTTWALSFSLTPIGFDTIIWFISITAFSGVMGIIAVFSPAGLGVRDGFYLLFLTKTIGPEYAALITVLLRLLQTFIDFALAILGALYLKYHR